jgi:hypothetical protein
MTAPVGLPPTKTSLVVSLKSADRRFLTYANYALGLKLASATSSPEDQVASVASSRAFRQIHRKPNADYAAVSRLLRNSWMTELAVRHAAQGRRQAPASLAWVPVQVYFAAFTAMRALEIAMGNIDPDSHGGMLNCIAGTITRRPELLPDWMSATCSGTPGSFAYERVPPGTRFGGFSSIVVPSDPWCSLAALLRTTRDELLEASWASKRNKLGVQRLPNGERARLAGALRPTTLFDALFRLRKRANYRDTDDLIGSIHDAAVIDRYATSFEAVLDRILLGVEVVVARYVAKRRYSDLLDEFRRMHSESFKASPASIRARAILQVL